MVTNAFGFVDVLINFLDQRSKIKSLQLIAQKPDEYNIFVKIFTKIWSCICLHMRHTDWVKRSKVTAVGGITVDGSPSSSIYTVSQKLDHPTDGDNFVKT